MKTNPTNQRPRAEYQDRWSYARALFKVVSFVLEILLGWRHSGNNGGAGVASTAQGEGAARLAASRGGVRQDMGGEGAQDAPWWARAALRRGVLLQGSRSLAAPWKADEQAARARAQGECGGQGVRDGSGALRGTRPGPLEAGGGIFGPGSRGAPGAWGAHPTRGHQGGVYERGHTLLGCHLPGAAHRVSERGGDSRQSGPGGNKNRTGSQEEGVRFGRSRGDGAHKGQGAREALPPVCQGVEEKRETLTTMSREVLPTLRGLAGQAREALQAMGTKTLESLSGRARKLREFTERLVPQIEYWLETGKVAREKLLHPGVEEARSIPGKKAGKKWLYGFKWLINRFSGGYISAKMYLGVPSEQKMPLEALELYQVEFGDEEVPELLVYDRGGDSKANRDALKAAGVAKVGIQPKGQGEWSVGESEQVTVGKLRSRAEGVIGTLKEAYGFNKPKQRSRRTIEMAGHASVVSFNLNKLMRDIITQEQETLQAA